MARNRMIKTKFWDDTKIGRISRDARLLYIGMWNFADDLGVIIADSVWLKSKIFPYDSIQIQQFDKFCHELLRNGFISLFSFRNEKFYYLPNFSRHQKINKPNYDEVNVPKKLLERCLSKITNQSRNDTGLITNQSIPKIEEEIEDKEELIIPPNPQGEGEEEIISISESLLEREKSIDAKEQELLKRETALKSTEQVKIASLNFVSEDFKDVFSLWLEYKRDRRESYKSQKSLQVCYSNLLKFSNNSPDVAKLIIEQSIANNWAGIFELKNDGRRTEAVKRNTAETAGEKAGGIGKYENIQSDSTPQKKYSGRF